MNAQIQPSSIDLSCANPCCFQDKQSCVEHVLVETSDDFIAIENDELKREVEKLNNDLKRLKSNNHVEPSQNNHEVMVKKLEKGTTATCVEGSYKVHKKQVKSSKSRVKKKAHIKCFNCSFKGHFASK